jgi:uncharacterized protein (UPF0335 family)
MNKEIMYHLNSIIIAIILFTLILLAYDISFRIGRRKQRVINQEVKTQTNSIQSGIYGLLALLLAFSFNMALQRFDNRNQAVIMESNAIGTALLRTKLLPKPYDSIAYNQLQQYVNLRLELNIIDLTNREERVFINQKTDSIQNKIWENTIKITKIDSRPVTTGNFIIALNEVFDAQNRRNAIFQQHIPESILFLLFIVFITGGALMGYSSGLGLRRALIPTIIFTLLIVLVIFIILDLDRPTRGLIKVKMDNLFELRQS